MIKSGISVIVLCIGLSAGCAGLAAAADPVSHIQPEREVLTEAEAVGFDYIGNLRRAERREIAAAVALINFSIQTDAAGALAHGWVLLELGKIMGRKSFSTSLARATSVGRKSAREIMKVASTYK